MTLLDDGEDPGPVRRKGMFGDKWLNYIQSTHESAFFARLVQTGWYISVQIFYRSGVGGEMSLRHGRRFDPQIVFVGSKVAGANDGL